MIDHHLQEIDDAAGRAGVNTFKTQMEIVVLSLFDRDSTIALTQIEEARTVSLDALNHSGSAFLSPSEAAKAGRVATAMVTHTFARLRTVMESPDDDDGVNGGGS